MRSFLVTLALAALAPHPAAGEPGRVSFAVRSGFDVGSVAVPGTDHGLGLGASLRVAFGGTSALWELGAEADIAGYTGSADGDPILHLGLIVSRRWELGATDASSRAYCNIGGGLGLQGIATGGVVFPLRAALGVALFAGKAVGLDLALYERFAPVHGDGEPAWEFVNSAGLEVALRFGR